MEIKVQLMKDNAQETASGASTTFAATPGGLICDGLEIEELQ